MQQGWGPQGPIGGPQGQMMGQGIGLGRMVPTMNTGLPTRGPPGSRAMVNMQMMGNGEEKKDGKKDRWIIERTRKTKNLHLHFFAAEMEMANPSYPQQQAPPNQTAPWPDRMMMDHYGNQSRFGILFNQSADERFERELRVDPRLVTLTPGCPSGTAFLRRMGWGVAPWGPRASRTRGPC